MIDTDLSLVGPVGQWGDTEYSALSAYALAYQRITSRPGRPASCCLEGSSYRDMNLYGEPEACQCC